MAELRLIEVAFVQHENHHFESTPFMNGCWRLTYQRFSNGGYVGCLY